MAFTHAQIDALKAALALGVTTVEYQGKWTTYRSLAEMRVILGMMQGEVNAAAGTPRKRTVRFVGETGR